MLLARHQELIELETNSPLSVTRILRGLLNYVVTCLCQCYKTTAASALFLKKGTRHSPRSHQLSSSSTDVWNEKKKALDYRDPHRRAPIGGLL